SPFFPLSLHDALPISLGVILASDGNLYGTTGNSNPGTVFRVSPTNGQFKTIYSFPSSVFPVNRLTQYSNGTLYGVSRSSVARSRSEEHTSELQSRGHL